MIYKLKFNYLRNDSKMKETLNQIKSTAQAAVASAASLDAIEELRVKAEDITMEAELAGWDEEIQKDYQQRGRK